MTPSQFKKAAVRAFRAANPGSKATLTWTYGPVAVRWADGTPGMSGTFKAVAPGYRAKRMVAALMDGRVSVR